MDRIEFAKSIDIDKVTQMKWFFNEIMGFYNLIEGYNYDYIHGSIDEVKKTIKFTVSFNDNVTADIVHKLIMSTGLFVSYDKLYAIQSARNGDNQLAINIENVIHGGM